MNRMILVNKHSNKTDREKKNKFSKRIEKLRKKTQKIPLTMFLDC